MPYKAYVFDAYGTLFDAHSAVSNNAALVGPDAARVSEIWRNKQLEYSWTRSGMKKYKDFWALTAEALDYALASVPGANKASRNVLLAAYEKLDCYPEVPAVLEGLKQGGYRTAILSNGSPEMLRSAVKSSGIEALLDDVFSVDEIGVFKTDPATYAMVTGRYGIQPQEVSFQSSNRWDVAGATAFGFDVRWINRTNQPDEYPDLQPRQVLRDLNWLVTD